MTTAHTLPLGLRSAYLAMHRQTDACLAKSGCTADQFVLLGLLAREDGCTQQELVRRASSDPNTVRAMLVLLEQRGLIARMGHPDDGRARSVTLTGKGRRVHRRQLADTEPLRKRLRALFSPEEEKALVDLLARVSEALSAPQGREQARKAKRRIAVRIKLPLIAFTFILSGPLCLAQSRPADAALSARAPERKVPALKDVFQKHFLIGGALNRNLVTGRDPGAAAIAEKHFSTAT